MIAFGVGGQNKSMHDGVHVRSLFRFRVSLFIPWCLSRGSAQQPMQLIGDFQSFPSLNLLWLQSR